LGHEEAWDGPLFCLFARAETNPVIEDTNAADETTHIRGLKRLVYEALSY
jgi:hypothetical protein